MSNSAEVPLCSICYSPLFDNLSATECGHVYHSNWYK